MVVISLPWRADSGSTQDRVGTPRTCTVHAPHCAAPHPNFVPFRSRTSRNTHSRGMSGGTSTVAAFPLTLRVTVMGFSSPPTTRQQCAACQPRCRWASKKSCPPLRIVACSASIPTSHRGCERMPAVGNSVARKDGIGKATGSARYADGLAFPGMIHGRTIRSTIPRGRVKSTRFGFDTAGFTIVDYRDIIGRNSVDLIEKDQPFLVEQEVRHVAEPILLLAHEDRERLNAAHVEIEYEEEVPVFDPEQSSEIFKKIDIMKGDPVSALAAADLVVEG